MMLDPSFYHSATLPGLLKHWSDTTPDRLAFREKDFGIWERMTFRDYYEKTKDFAYGLIALGVKKGDFLAVAGENTPEWMYSDLAMQALGGACIGIYPTNPWVELRYILDHSGSSIAVCGDQEQTDKVFDAIEKGGPLANLRKIICVDMKGMRKYPRDMLMSFDEVLELGRSKRDEYGDEFERCIAEVKPEDTAVIVYTSGTTGMPKGAMLSHRGLIFGAVKLGQKHDIADKGIEVVCYLPLCHVAERLCSSVQQLVHGSAVNFGESIDTVAENLREISPSFFLGVPRIWEKMQNSIMVKKKDATRLQQWVIDTSIPLGLKIAARRQENNGRFASIADQLQFLMLWLICFRPLQKYLGLNKARTMLCGGATVSPEVLEFFWALGLKVYQVYGMTELSGISHTQYWGCTGKGLSGRPMEGYEHRIANDGEILVRSPAVFNGYLNDEQATRSTFDGDWLKTGDIGEIRSDNSIAVTDRKKDIIITSGGKNITPSLIENRAKDSPYIRECVLIGERRNFLAALIQVDFETVGKWAQEQGLAYTNFKSLSERTEVRKLIADEIDILNTEFSRVENIRKFTLLSKELDHDDGEVTATMKVRRSVIEEKFKSLVDAMYQG